MVAPEIVPQADLYLSGTRPPVLKDYFDERLRMNLHVPSSAREVAVGFQIQVSDRPIS